MNYNLDSVLDIPQHMHWSIWQRLYDLLLTLGQSPVEFLSIFKILVAFQNFVFKFFGRVIDSYMADHNFLRKAFHCVCHFGEKGWCCVEFPWCVMGFGLQSNFCPPLIMPNFCHQKRIDKKYLISKLLSFWQPHVKITIVLRVIFCDDFFVIFDTPIFGHLPF